MKKQECFKAKQPVIPIRGVHLDLKGCPPTATRLLKLLQLFAAARFNAVLVEWEDAFPWTVDKRFRSSTAYTVEDVRRFLKTAQGLGLEIIPLVQCLGHMETPLSLPDYEHLRETPDNPSVLNPTLPAGRDLVVKMVDDVLSLMPEARYFHLGGDEALSIGENPETRAYMEQHGKAALYLQHVEPILDRLNKAGIRPILWHDMMIDWDDHSLKSLAAKSDLLTWGYSTHPDTTSSHFNTKYIKRFHELGFKLWAGTAYKGADGDKSDRPNIQKREMNALAWMEITQRYDSYAGIIATAWSRYSTGLIQCEPVDAALDSLFNIGVIMHDGLPPDGGLEACVAALEELGERERFESCKTAMERLADIRQRGWKTVQWLSEQAVLCRINSRRGGTYKVRILKKLSDIIEESENIADDVWQSFDGLMEPVWIEEYLNTRLIPFHEELARFDKSNN